MTLEPTVSCPVAWCSYTWFGTFRGSLIWQQRVRQFQKRDQGHQTKGRLIPLAASKQTGHPSGEVFQTMDAHEESRRNVKSIFTCVYMYIYIYTTYLFVYLHRFGTDMRVSARCFPAASLTLTAVG